MLGEAGERLDKVDYFKRLWVALYAADVDVIADCLEEVLDQGMQEVTPFKTQLDRVEAER